MTRVRRRIARDRLESQATPAEREYFAWAAQEMRDRGWACQNPDHPEADLIRARSIRIRRWRSAEWDRLRGAGVPIPEAQRAMRRIPPVEVLP